MKVSFEDIKIFSELSNDYNPIHIDYDYSYKTIFDKPIVPGILLLLKCFNHAKYVDYCQFEYLKVKFYKYINVNEIFIIKHNNTVENKIIEIYNEDKTLTTKIEYNFLNNIKLNNTIIDYDNNLRKPINLKYTNLFEKYDLELNINNNILKEYFNNIYESFDLNQIYQIINLSAFVGMISPGLNSIFYSFEYYYQYNNNDNKIIKFMLNENNYDIKTYKYIYEGYNSNGMLISIYRPESINQIKIKDIQINNTQYLDDNILIIGGSRGLGEVIAKIFYCGGANVTITYYKCEKDALNIKNESNGKINILKFDIENDIGKINELSESKYTRVFYMATPKLYQNNTFNIDIFNLYYKYYCINFNDLINYLNKDNLKYIFYPSSEYLNNPDKKYEEYITAKILGEKIVDALNIKYPHIDSVSIRLPRLETDLTNTFINTAKNPFDYFIDIFKVKKKNKNIKIISNLNTDLIDFYFTNKKKNYYLNYELNKSSFGQLYQDLIEFNEDIINSDYIFFILSLEDILNDDIVFYYKDEYNVKIDNFIQLLKKFIEKRVGGNNYIFQIKQKIKSPFDNTEYSLNNLINKLNNEIMNINNIKLIDYNFNDKLFDIDLYLQGRISYTSEFFNFICNEIIGILLQNDGKTIKCIVIDLDNTLWGGVLVENGLDGIEISNDYPYNKWLLFQKVLKIYNDKGILLCICSKNDEENVIKALEKKENFLKKHDFSIIKANWIQKSVNIKEIALSLNINEEHILFIDDNIIEREEVKMNLPKCKVLEIEQVDPIHYIEKILENPYLYNFNITKSDFEKNQQYKIKNEIDSFKNNFNNLEDFYYSLNTNIIFKLIDLTNVDRAFQLTKKTNQFNLNKYLFNENEFKQYINNNMCIIIEYNDKFTNFDQIGVILLEHNNDYILVNNIILSCRVFNRDFEKCIFALLKNLSKITNKSIHGILKKIESNKKFHNIYNEFGFDEINNIFIYNYHNEYIIYPKWINVNEDILNLFKLDFNYSSKNNIDIIEQNKYNTVNINNIDNEINKYSDELYLYILNQFSIKTKIKQFNEIDNFSSLTMVLLLSKLNKKYNKTYTISYFFDDNGNFLNIFNFCDRINKENNKKNNNENNNENNNQNNNEINENNENNELIDYNHKNNIKLKPEDFNLKYIENNKDLYLLNEFIIKNYSEKFAFVDNKIKKWNFDGYRDISEKNINILINKKNNNINGIFGATNIYMQYYKNNNLNYIKSIEFMLWNYIKSNNKILSLDPIYYLINNFDLFFASNLIEDTSLPILKSMNFHIIENIDCYVIALKDTYKNLLIDYDNDNDNDKINNWIKNVFYDILNINELIKTNFDIYKLEKLWLDFSNNYNLLSVYKNYEYWNWRYIKSEYFKYYINGNDDMGYIIWREEETFTNNKGIRIIEIIPTLNSIKNIDKFKLFINKFIKYCVNNNYEVIDFFCTSDIISNILILCNFIKKNTDNTGISSIPIYFKLKKQVQKRNIGIYIKNKDILKDNILYFTKSLLDLDKPLCKICKNPFCKNLYNDNNCE